MLEIIKEAGTILKDLPDLAIWILVGILFYKVFIIGGTINLIKFIVNKVHDYLTKPKEVTTNVRIDNRFITHDGTYRDFLSLLDKIHSHVNTPSKGEYLHHRDVQWMREAIEKQILEDIENERKL